MQPARVPDGQDCDRRQQHATYRHHRPHRQAQQHLNGRAPPLARTIICTVLDMGSSSGLPEYCKPLAISKQLRRQGFAPMALEALIPGITVGCMVVPQGIAYALMAGLPPVYGLYSATAALFVYALLGCSPQLAIASSSQAQLAKSSRSEPQATTAATAGHRGPHSRPRPAAATGSEPQPALASHSQEQPPTASHSQPQAPTGSHRHQQPATASRS